MAFRDQDTIPSLWDVLQPLTLDREEFTHRFSTATGPVSFGIDLYKSNEEKAYNGVECDRGTSHEQIH